MDDKTLVETMAGQIARRLMSIADLQAMGADVQYEYGAIAGIEDVAVCLGLDAADVRERGRLKAIALRQARELRAAS